MKLFTVTYKRSQTQCLSAKSWCCWHGPKTSLTVHERNVCFSEKFIAYQTPKQHPSISFLSNSILRHFHLGKLKCSCELFLSGLLCQLLHHCLVYFTEVRSVNPESCNSLSSFPANSHMQKHSADVRRRGAGRVGSLPLVLLLRLQQQWRGMATVLSYTAAPGDLCGSLKCSMAW